MKIKIKNESGHDLPNYQTSLAAGMDIKASLTDSMSINPGERVLIPTGLYVELPPGFEAQIRPRSGLAFKHGITVLNSPGTIDADYRGEIKILLINLGHQSFDITNGERIAQMIIAKHESVQWESTEELTDTLRSSGGFGSTGK